MQKIVSIKRVYHDGYINDEFHEMSLENAVQDIVNSMMGFSFDNFVEFEDGTVIEIRLMKKPESEN